MLQHPQVHGAAAVAMRHRLYGEAVCLYVVPAGAGRPQLHEIRNFLEERGLARFKLPARVELVDALPHGGSGKGRQGPAPQTDRRPGRDRKGGQGMTRLSIGLFCGSSREIPGHYLELAAQVGAGIAERGWGLVSGGEHVSMMGAVAAAARAGGAHTLGVVPRRLLTKADFESDELVVTESMGERKALMLASAHALLVLPGGLGTCEELFEASRSSLAAVTRASNVAEALDACARAGLPPGTPVSGTPLTDTAGSGMRRAGTLT